MRKKTETILVLPTVAGELMLLESFSELFRLNNASWGCWFSVKPDAQDVEWLNRVCPSWSVYDSMPVDKELLVVQKLFERLYAIVFAFLLVTFKRCWKTKFIVLEGGCPISYGISVLSKWMSLNVTYIAHGVHLRGVRIAYPKSILFGGIEQARDIKLPFGRKPDVAKASFVRSIGLARELKKLLRESKKVAGDQGQWTLLFFGGWEDCVDHATCGGVIDEATCISMAKQLSELKDSLSKTFLDIRFVYRPHPRGMPAFNKYVRPYLNWEISKTSLLEDILSANAAATFLSTAVFETAGVGIPSFVLDSPLANSVLEQNPGSKDMPILAKTSEVESWIALSKREPFWLDEISISDHYSRLILEYSSLLR
jgi:hypothetical protein